jgi:hypothetical protein
MCHHRHKFFGSWGSIFTPWERQTPDFDNAVTRANNTPVPLRRRNHDIIILAKYIPQGSVLTKMVFDKIGQNW